MRALYSIGINSYVFGIRIAALWNKKAALWIKGRKGLTEKLAQFKPGGKVYWFHCASLGEFEQARPLIESLKEKEKCQVVITFFSPSGFELRKDYALADLIIYLPKDTRRNAKLLLDALQPSAVFFVKYEFWANFIFETKHRNIPLYCISAVFRPSQSFFKWYGGFMRKVLGSFNAIFVQDAASKDLLQSIGIASIYSGDTRYDRVMKNAQNVITYPEVERLINGRKVFICGSIWPPDLEVIFNGLKTLDDDWFVIIASHEIKESFFQEIENKMGKGGIRYSGLNADISSDYLIIDNIGMLMNLYQYGRLAYVGGAFKTGLHNILEPAAFGIPVVFGPKHGKFPEAARFIEAGIGFSISSDQEFKDCLKMLMEQDLSNKTILYMENQCGATNKIIEAISI